MVLAQNCDMLWTWTIRCFLSDAGRDVICEWYGEEPETVQAAFDTRLKFLTQNSITSWTRPYFDKLNVTCPGISEIRFKADKVQYRPLGFFGPKPGEFTIVALAIEKGDALKPKGICKVAQDRKKLVLANPNQRSRICFGRGPHHESETLVCETQK